MKAFYLVAAVVGTVVPWLFFGMYFADNGVDPAGFVRSLFSNGAAGGFSADVLISILVFWVWGWRAARANGVRRWWIGIDASFVVGLSLALPLYLYFRETTLAERRSAPGAVRTS